MTTFIHVGLHKAGSTTLQSSLAEHREALGQFGFVYPEYPGNRYAGHHLLACQLSRPRSSVGPNDLFLAEREAFAASTRARVEAPTPLRDLAIRASADIILSSEIFCTFDLSELARLHEYAAPSKYVLYYRSGIRFIHSCWLAKVRWGYDTDFEVFFRSTIRAEQSTPIAGGVGYVQMLCKAFGAEQVAVRSFQKALSHPRSILGDFVEDELLSDPIAASVEPKNESPPAWRIELFRAVRSRLSGSGSVPKYSYGRFDRLSRSPEGISLLASLSEEVSAALTPISIALVGVEDGIVRLDGTLALPRGSGVSRKLQGWIVEPNECVRCGRLADLVTSLGGNHAFEKLLTAVRLH